MSIIRKGGEPVTLRRAYDSARRRIVNRLFPINALRGVYGSFEEAERSAPAVKPIGYDVADSANWYEEKFSQLELEDYPVLFWLKTAFGSGSTSLFEIGGHVGEAFYAYRRLLAYPQDLEWTVFDVPSIVAEGAVLAGKNGATGLRFVPGPDEVAHADIILAAGALQYFEDPVLVDIVRGMQPRPAHIIVNNTPLYGGASFVTLQNIGSVYCPYRIFNRDELVASIEAQGYALTDSWRKARRVHVPFHPDRCFDHYSGLYFRRV